MCPQVLETARNEFLARLEFSKGRKSRVDFLGNCRKCQDIVSGSKKKITKKYLDVFTAGFALHLS